MKLKNEKERSDLFLKFLLLFILTVSIVIFALFFDFKLPKDLSVKQKAKLSEYNTFHKSQKEVYNAVDSIILEIESFGVSNQDETLKSRIADKIGRLKDIPTQKDSGNSKFVKKLESVLTNYFNFKIKSTKGVDATSDCEKEKEELKEKLKECKDELRDQKMLNAQLGK